MPSLDLASALRQKYQISPSANKTFMIGDGRMIRKSFRLEEGFDPSRVRVSEDVINAFDSGQNFRVSLVFVDITDFSGKTETLPNGDIIDMLDEYYKKVIPTVYKHGGEVEKIIGDGIIAVFGEPFINEGLDPILSADAFCKEAVKTLYGGDLEVKCALHEGLVLYANCGSPPYYDFTMVGKAVTELFRLESVARNNSVAFYRGTRFERLHLGRIRSFQQKGDYGLRRAKWFLTEPEEHNLPGVDYHHVRYLEYNVD